MSDIQASVPNYVEVMRDFIDSRLVDFMRLLPADVDYHNMIIMGSALSLLETLIPTGKTAVETDREALTCCITKSSTPVTNIWLTRMNCR